MTWRRVLTVLCMILAFVRLDELAWFEVEIVRYENEGGAALTFCLKRFGIRLRNGEGDTILLSRRGRGILLRAASSAVDDSLFMHRNRWRMPLAAQRSQFRFGR